MIVNKLRLAYRKNKTLFLVGSSVGVGLLFVAMIVVIQWLTVTPPAKAAREIKIEITDTGFVPQNVVIEPGTKVVWVNSTLAPHKIGANPFPEGDTLPNLKSGDIVPDGSYTYVFKEEGAFGYTDYSEPTTGGSIVVEQQ